MKARDKRIAAYLIFFIFSFLAISFASSFNIDNKTFYNSSTKRENAIFLNQSSTSSNYLAMRISRIKVMDIFIETDSLPPFVDSVKNIFEMEKIINIVERAYKILGFYTILDRDKRRILLI